MQRYKKIIIITLVGVSLITAGLSALLSSHGLWLMAAIGDKINQWEGKTLNRDFQTKIKSGNLSTDYEIEQALRDIESLDLNTVNVPVAVNIENLSSSTMSLDENSISKAKKLIKKLRSKKINIILEPYPWITNGQYFETDWNPKDKEAFFHSWKNNVIGPIIEKVAIPMRVDALCIASNLVHMEEYEDKWSDIADFAKSTYKGLITYKTNWWYTAIWDESTLKRYERKLNNRVFSHVDYISIAAYFEISEKPLVSAEELKNNIYLTPIHKRQQNIVEEVEQFYKKWNKPVFFGELGFPRRNNAAEKPWHPLPSNIVNDQQQASCFKAYSEVFNQDWFLGFSIFAIGNKSEDKNYYPSEESIEVIRQWFK